MSAVSAGKPSDVGAVGVVFVMGKPLGVGVVPRMFWSICVPNSRSCRSRV